MRVLHVCETAGIGGAETVVLAIARHLNRARFESHALLMMPGWLERQLRAQRLPVTVMESMRSYDIGFLWRLVRFVQSHHIHIIHSHLPDANAYAALAGHFARVPVVTTYHGLTRPWIKPSAGDLAKLHLARYFACRMVAVSGSLKSDLCRWAAMSPDRVELVYNGIDWSPHDQIIDREARRREFGIDPDDRIVGMVANFRPVKGHTILVRAMAQVVRSIPRARLLLIGEEETIIRQEIVETADSLGIADRITILGYRDDVPQLLQILDVFAISSHSEGHPLSTLEAMGAGLPVVVTRVGGHPELIEDGKTGWLVHPRDETALADRIIYLLKHPQVASEVAARARRITRRQYDVRNMVTAYEALYHACVT